MIECDTAIRVCDHCGKPIADGEGFYMDGDGFSCHEECFEEYMDETYGKHKWMSINDDGCDGYYIYSEDSVVGGYLGTGIFWTTDEG